MDEVSPMVICILLVDADLANSARVSHLLKSKYKVVTARKGGDAMRVLMENRHCIDMVLTDINLPDVCAFEFVKAVEKETRLPVVMICDTYDRSTIAKGLQSGAMLCLVKPLCFDAIKNLWQFPIIKRRQVMLEPCQVLMAGVPETETELHGSSSGSQRYKKRKMSLGQSSSFVWTESVFNRSLSVCQEFGFSEASSSNAVPRPNTPGLTRSYVAKRVQLTHMCVGRNQRLPLLSPSPPITARSVVRPVFAPNFPSMTGQPMGLGTNNSRIPSFRLEDSTLARYLANPQSEEELKRIAIGAVFKWRTEHGIGADQPNILAQGAPWGIPSPLATAFAGAYQPNIPAQGAPWGTLPPLATAFAGSYQPNIPAQGAPWGTPPSLATAFAGAYQPNIPAQGAPWGTPPPQATAFAGVDQPNILAQGAPWDTPAFWETVLADADQPNILAQEALWGAAPPPRATAFAGAPEMPPPTLVPAAHARELEQFIYRDLSGQYGQPGSFRAQVSAQGGDEQVGPGFLDELDIEDLLEVIEKLLK